MFDHIINILGAIHKGHPHPRGRGLAKSGHMQTQGVRRSVAKSGRPQNQNFTEISDFPMLKINFDMWTSGGGVAMGVVRDGQNRANFLQTSFMDGPSWLM